MKRRVHGSTARRSTPCSLSEQASSATDFPQPSTRCVYCTPPTSNNLSAQRDPRAFQTPGHPSLGQLVSHLRVGAPQWGALRNAALARAKQRLAHARLDGIDWYWPATEKPMAARWQPDERVRLLTPFDPVVWDRRRFETFWGWAYRFEAYTPAPKRKLGYYALPLLWRDAVVGWGNLSVSDATLHAEIGFAARSPMRDAGFKSALQAELAAMARFLGMDDGASK
jgi:hypothetical protein